MTRGKSWVEEVASIAKESACALPFLGICSKSKESNFDCKHLTWLRYPCILSSFASNSPFTWLKMSLESEKTFTNFPPILWTMAIPINKTSYSASLFVAEKSNLKDFSMMTFSGDISTSLIPEPFWFDASSTYTSRPEGHTGRSCQPIFHPCFLLIPTLLLGVQWIRQPNLQELVLLWRYEACIWC